MPFGGNPPIRHRSNPPSRFIKKLARAEGARSKGPKPNTNFSKTPLPLGSCAATAHTGVRTRPAPSTAPEVYSALDHSAIDADTKASRNLIYELLWKENWCQQRVSENKNQGRIRTRNRYLNLKNLITMYSAFDHSAIVTDENYNRN